MSMRIPITIKVPVRVAGHPSEPSLANIVIRDLSSGLEKITVRLLHRTPPNNKLARKKPAVGGEIHRSSPTRFPVVFRPHTIDTPTPVIVVPRHRYTVKTIHITLTWPTPPTRAELRYMLTHISKKVWLRTVAIALLAGVIVVFLHLPSSNDASSSSDHSATVSHLPPLTRGTPSYRTVLPAGKTINQLGGWTRISPPDKDPVYTYVDKINNVQINVSEQPLPKAFQHDTANQISQFANSYNATDKFTASNNTAVYVASSANGSQSVILAKAGLLILIKSAAPLNNNQWTAYISSLK